MCIKPKGHERNSLSVLAAAIACLLGATSLRAVDAPKLYVEPIPGFTTARHAAPEAITVPVGTVLSLSHQLFQRPGQNPAEPVNPNPDPVAAVPADEIRWFGAVEIERKPDMSWAELAVEQEGVFVVRASLVGLGGAPLDHTLYIRAVDVPADRVTIRSVSPRVDSLSITEESTNAETMQAYFGESIADLVPTIASRGAASRGAKTALNRFRTSVNRTVRFDLRTDPAGFESLMEVRTAGLQPYLAESHPQYFNEPGIHRLSVGPPRLARELEIETYEVRITSHVSGLDRITDGQLTTFEAVTDPPGSESEINWIASTKFGSAQPVTGHGPTFITRFENFRGFAPDNPGVAMQWLGVKASNTVFGDDGMHGCALADSCVDVGSLTECQGLGGSYSEFAQCPEENCTPLVGRPNQQRDSCSGQGKCCLFVDAAGCAITCPGTCSVTGASCAFGFGIDAVCTCTN